VRLNLLSGAWAEIQQRQPGMMLLVAMAISVAYATSLATTIGWFDLEFRWELSALVTIMLLGHWLEMKALGQAQSALAALAELLPDEAERIDADGSITVVRMDALELGDVVLVRPGGRVPADGTIIEGSAEIDESMVTGESRPVAKGANDRVVAGPSQPIPRSAFKSKASNLRAARSREHHRRVAQSWDRNLVPHSRR